MVKEHLRVGEGEEALRRAEELAAKIPEFAKVVQYACQDPRKYIDQMLEAVPDLVRLLIGATKQEMDVKSVDCICLLLEGMIALLSGRPFAKKLGEAFGIDKDMLAGLLAIVRGDLEGAVDVARTLGNFDSEKVGRLLKLIKRLEPLTKETNLASVGSLSPPSMDLSAMSREEIFNLVDTDDSKCIDVEEFKKLFKLDLTEQTVMELFAQCDDDSSGFIDFHEFEKAMKILESQIAGDSLVMLGLSKLKLATLFFVSLLILAGLFLFIFFGIAAFTTGSGFSAVINSVLPLTGGGALGAKEEGGNKTTLSASVSAKINDCLGVMSKT